MEKRRVVIIIAAMGLCVNLSWGQAPTAANVFELGRMNWDEEFATQCIQGIANRGGANLYLMASNHGGVYGPYYSHLWAGADSTWKKYYADYKSKPFNPPVPDLDSLIKIYKTNLNSQFVLYDPSIETEDMVAATYAGINTCLPVTPAMMARQTPGMRGAYGWVDENMGTDAFQKIFTLPGPPIDTTYQGLPGDSVFMKGGDFLVLSKRTAAPWIGAWFNGVTIDCATYPILAIRITSKNTTDLSLVVKLKAPWNPQPYQLHKYQTSDSVIANSGIYFLQIPTELQNRGTVEFERMEINLCGTSPQRAVADWIISCRTNNLSSRVRKNLLDEEGSTTSLWNSATGTNLTSITYREPDSTQALKAQNSGTSLGWIRTQNCTLNVSKLSRIIIRIDSCNGLWGLDVKQSSSGTWTILQPTQSATGTYRYAWPQGWNGLLSVDVRVNINQNNKKVVMNSLRAIALPLDSIGWTVSKSYVDSFSTRYEAQNYAKNNLFGPSHGQTGKIGFCGNAGLSTYLGLDYVVGNRGYAFRLDNYRPSPDEHTLFNNIVSGLSRGDSCAPIFGYLDDSGYRNAQGKGNNEYEYMVAMTLQGGYMMCTPGQNLSFHAKMGNTVPQQKQHITRNLDTSKVYVALMLSEGDTPKFAFSFFGGSWKQDTSKGRIPFNWGINPLFAEVCPAILEYYYNTMADSDYFFAGCSGAGAALPVYYDANHLGSYAKLFKRTGQAADICISDIWQADDEGEKSHPKLQTYADTATNAKGFTVMQDKQFGQMRWGRTAMTRDTIPAVCTFKSQHYWVTFYDTNAYNLGWTVRTKMDTVKRCSLDQEAAWDSIAYNAPGADSLTKVGRWQKVLALRLWEEYVRHNQRTPVFTALFSSPKPASQVVGFARGMIDSANALANQNGKSGLFKFVTLYEMMDAAKQALAQKDFHALVTINDGAKFTNSPYVTLKLPSLRWQADSMIIWDADSTSDTIPRLQNPIVDQNWHFHDESNGTKWVYTQFKMGRGIYSDTARDSIILDATMPFAEIFTPVDSQTVGLGTSVPFVGWSYDFEDHDSLWEIWEDYFPWASGNTKVGTHPFFGFPDTFGFWNSYGVGWHTHALTTQDSAKNSDTVVVHVYVADMGDGGSGFAAGFGAYPSSPMNVATDPSGNVYVAETQGSRIRKQSPNRDSLFAFSARRGNDTTGVTWPTAITLKDSTVLWVADGLNDCIKKFDRQGNLLLRFGSHGSDTGHFDQPCGIALDGKNRLWIVDRRNDRIQVYDTTGNFLFGFGSHGTDSGRLDQPCGIAIVVNPQTKSGRLLRGLQGLAWITDAKNNQIQVFDSLGNWKKTIKRPDSLGFDTPTGICTDKHGDIFIADTKNHRIVELNPFGRRLFTFGSQGDSLYQFRNPIGVASSPGGHYLYVADMGNRRVQRFTVIHGDTLGGGGPQGRETLRLPPKVNFMSQSHPNPTTGEAVIEYGLAKESPVTLSIYNVAGQVVKEYNPGKQKAWYYSIKWDGRSNQGHRVGAGVYFYRLTAGSWAKTRKMVVVK
jgi:hypothetical protein